VSAPHRVIQADALLVGGELQFGLAVKVDPATGDIVSVAPPEMLYGPTAEVLTFPGRVLLPGGVNSHSHAFQVLLRGWADRPRDFHDWVDRCLYPLVLALDEDGLEAAMLLAFAEMAQNGITTVGEFHYIHNAPEGEAFHRLGNRYAELAIRTARRVGLRIGLLRCLYDRGERKAQRRFQESVGEAIESTRALAGAFRQDPAVAVSPAPHSLHGASAEMLAAAARLAEELDRPLHIHLAEQRGDVEVARGLYGTTPLRALEKLGVLGRRLVVVHGCWLEAEEWERLGAAGGGLAYNPGANLFLGDGVTDLDAAVRAGVCISLGCDGPGANSRLDLFGEMRLAEGLQRLRRLGMNGIEPERLLAMATRDGGRTLGFPVGEIAAGQRADLIALDIDDLGLAPRFGLKGRAFVSNLIHSVSVRAAVTDVLVGGDPIVRDRELVKVDPLEVRTRARAVEKRLGPVVAPFLGA